MASAPLPDPQTQGIPLAEPAPPEPQPPDYGGPGNPELPDQLVNALTALVREFQSEDRFDRRREVLRDRRNRFYERGYQHIYESSSNSYSQMVAGQTVNASGESHQCSNYIDDYNVFQPALQTLIATLTQNAPGVNFRPIDMSRSADMEAADVAEGTRKFFNATNDAKGIQTEAIRMFGVSSRCILWTRLEEDEELFGKSEDGPRSGPVTTVHGTLESKVPITAKCQKEFLYCLLLDDPPLKTAKSEYPQFKSKIKPGPALGEQEFERIARLGVFQGARRYTASSSDSLNHLVARACCWLRPEAFIGDVFDDVFESAEGEEPISIGDKLRELFPRGCRITFVGSTYVGSWAEAMDECLATAHPYPGDGQFRLAMMDPGVVIQDRFNDDLNAYAEVKDEGWPHNWLDGDDADLAAIESQVAAPYAWHAFKTANQKTMGEHIYREPDPNLPPTFVASTQSLLDLLYYVLGTPPALFGQAEPDQKTASGFAQLRAQAMGRLGLAWGSLQALFACMYQQVAIAMSRNADQVKEIVVESEDGRAIPVHLEKLSNGMFRCYPDEDSSFPESTAAKRQTIDNVFAVAAQSPVGMQIIDSPDNLELYKEVHGLSELVIPEAEARNKQLREIELLLKESPLGVTPEALKQHAVETLVAQENNIPPPPPPQPQPTISVDALDFHPWEFKKGQEWLSSDACWREMVGGNQPGVQNVRLHVMQHQQFMAMQAPPPMPAPRPAMKPGGPGKLDQPTPIAAPPGAPGGLTM